MVGECVMVLSLSITTPLLDEVACTEDNHNRCTSGGANIIHKLHMPRALLCSLGCTYEMVSVVASVLSSNRADTTLNSMLTRQGHAQI